MPSQLAPLLDRLILVEVPEGGLIRLTEVSDPLPPTAPATPADAYQPDRGEPAVVSQLPAYTLWDDTPYMSVFPYDD